MTDKIDVQEVPSLKNIGEALKEKREELSYTLEHVSEVTCITPSNLRNLEDGNLNDLLGPVFVKGFIKNYARFLGIESSWMIDALNSDQSLEEHSSSDYRAVGQSEFSSSQSKSNYKYIIGVILLIFILGGLFLWNDKIFTSFVSDKETLETIDAVESESVSEKAGSNDAQDEKQTEYDQASQTAKSDDDLKKKIDIDAVKEQESDKQILSPLNLILVANQSQWIRLAIDDGEPFDFWLKKGEKYNWPAQEEYFLIMSSGSVASIHLNGEEIIEREKFMDQLYQVKLNKFTLKQINNR